MSFDQGFSAARGRVFMQSWELLALELTLVKDLHVYTGHRSLLNLHIDWSTFCVPIVRHPRQFYDICGHTTFSTNMRSTCRLLRGPPVCVSKTPWGFLAFFANQLGILVQILHTYYTFPSTLDYKFLFSYLQLWRSYAILRVTTQFTS